MTATHTDEERRSREVAEASREAEWKDASFLRDLFLGRFRLDLIHPFPRGVEGPRFREFYAELRRFLEERVDPVEIDAVGEYPEGVIAGLAELGAFGMKIPEKYGGLGLGQWEYGRAMELIGSFDGNLTALLSAHQSIGVPQPLKLFGTEEQKQRYLPRCARGAISAFALTETGVGSDPARLSTTARPSADGSYFVLDGEKLWCTNGTLAELLVVMARNPDTDAISAFVVETGWAGVKVEHRCRFMGLKALANGQLSFTGVKVPRENLIGEEGKGLKIALVTLNTGRLTLPAASSGAAKMCLEICRKWAQARVQWGRPVGEHEAIAHKLAAMAATTFAMESVAEYTSAIADREGFDIRLEAAAAKEWNTSEGWDIIDDCMQIRSGRGYETERSLAARGEAPVSAERMMRDFRINRIFEGSNEIMHLFMAREAVDRHLQVAGVLVDPDASIGDKLKALPRIGGFYASWYAGLWLGWDRWPRLGELGTLARHMRFVARSGRKLAREIFYGMAVYRARMQDKQAFLFRTVDIANELFAMALSVARARAMVGGADPGAEPAESLADTFCTMRRRKVEALFDALWDNDDAALYRVGRSVLDGDFAWLEEGSMGLGLGVDDLRPVPVSEKLRRRGRTAQEEEPAAVGKG